MGVYRMKKIIPPPGHMLGITLTGILLLSALLYYRAVNAQRYLEPSLAVAQPRIEFAQKITRLLAEEFGPGKVKGIIFTGNAIFVEDSLIFSDPVKRSATRPEFIKKMARVFLTILNDTQMKPHIDLIMIGTRLPVSPHPGMNRIKKIEMQNIAERIKESLYGVEPGLQEKYRRYFVATAVSDERTKSDRWVQFRIIPGEQLHIEMIKSLDKYFF